ncbi:MAG: 30S ribosomal protein S17, partial [Candidatus Methanomethylophilaceae archaeon]|nr:30S ribosomal protein S17 [Candidatus Methanomethylophilaceae archaeon]
MATKVRDIGIGVNPPQAECNDPNCPFHGSLPVRGQTIDGVVATVKMNKTVVVERSSLRYVKKY